MSANLANCGWKHKGRNIYSVYLTMQGYHMLYSKALHILRYSEKITIFHSFFLLLLLLSFLEFYSPTFTYVYQNCTHTVQLSYKVTSARVSLASFSRVTRAYHACRSRVSRVSLSRISHVTRV